MGGTRDVEYLIPCSDGDWRLGFEKWSEVFHPNTRPYERLPGIEYRLLIEGVPVFFADEMTGIQIAVEGELSEVIGRELADDVLANLQQVTGQRGYVVEL